MFSRTVHDHHEGSSSQEDEAVAPYGSLVLPQFTASASPVTSAHAEEIEHRPPTRCLNPRMLWQLGVAGTTCGMIGVIITS